jgi:hypothetical protein
MRCAGSPDWIRQSRKPVDDNGLCCQQHDGDFNDREIAGFARIPRETIMVVAPAGGWLTRSRTMMAPVSEKWVASQFEFLGLSFVSRTFCLVDTI